MHLASSQLPRLVPPARLSVCLCVCVCVCAHPEKKVSHSRFRRLLSQVWFPAQPVRPRAIFPGPNKPDETSGFFCVSKKALTWELLASPVWLAAIHSYPTELMNILGSISPSIAKQIFHNFRAVTRPKKPSISHWTFDIFRVTSINVSVQHKNPSIGK